MASGFPKPGHVGAHERPERRGARCNADARHCVGRAARVGRRHPRHPCPRRRGGKGIPPRETTELACTYDQVDISNLASMEALARHMQFIEHNVKKKKDTVKDFDSQDYYLGRQRRTGGAIISPELLKWVAESAARDSAILKEERKAAEERALARAPPKKS